MHILAGGVGGPVAVHVLFNSLADKLEPLQNLTVTSAAAGVGLFAGVAAHSFLTSVLRKKNVDTHKGSKIIQRAQAALYGLPVAVALIFNAVADKDISAYVTENASTLSVAAVQETGPDHLVQSAPVQLPSRLHPL